MELFQLAAESQRSDLPVTRAFFQRSLKSNGYKNSLTAFAKNYHVPRDLLFAEAVQFVVGEGYTEKMQIHYIFFNQP